MIIKISKTSQEFVSEWTHIFKAVFRLINTFYKYNKVATLGFYAATVIISAQVIVNSYINAYIIDSILNILNSGLHRKSDIINPLVIYLINSLAVEFTGSIKELTQVKLWMVIGRDYLNDIVAKISSLDLEYFVRKEPSNLINQVKRKGETTGYAIAGSLAYMIGSTISIVLPAFFILRVSYLIPIIIVITALPKSYVSLKYGRLRWGIWSSKGDVSKDYDRTSDILVSGSKLPETIVYGTREFLLKRMNRLFDQFMAEEGNYNEMAIKYGFIGKIVSVLGVVYSLYLLIQMSLAGEITIGGTVFYLTLISTLSNSVSSLIQNMVTIYESGLHLIDTQRLFDLKKLIIDGNHSLTKKRPPEIKIVDLSFNYPNSTTKSIDKINLTIKSGEKIAIVGENGSGKTTLINLILRFYDPMSGNIYLDGLDLKAVKLSTWYSQISTLFQTFINYHFDVKTNIAVRDIDKRNLSELVSIAAKKGGAHNFIKDLPNKYNQVLSTAFSEGTDLSVGQWQKVALSRAHFKDANMIVLDEPTSAIDPKSEAKIFDNLLKSAKNKTVIIISHRFSTVRHADRIIVMKKGRIIEEGTHEMLMEIEHGVYKQAFNVQKKGFE